MKDPFLAPHPAESTAGNIIEFTSGVDGAKSALWTAAFVFASILVAMPYAAQAGPASDSLNWSSSTKSNGASAVAVKKSISPFWDTRIGVDMTVAREPTTTWDLLAEKAANGGNAPQSSGIAWAAATAPGVGPVWDKTVVNARFDTGEQSSKIGTSLIKLVPLRSDYSLALQIDSDVVQKGKMPLFGLLGQVTRNYETHNSAKVTVTGIGTSFVVSETMSTTDDKWLRSFGAEQTLSNGITISSAIGETAQGGTNMSLTAGFKKSW
ncbi:hypothetical protein [Bradyrhizobium arachidis]|uniref:hypothetical protein n=1 Tax=Bradyrhizobium arachidis TaxID=858423 RepID=UPI0021614106|nr:hypothetical protein [Bradyrhizobium arachidis]UVO30212.1 hypothetical protein KUF59_05470 [Bradyrhizobium arachidis]